MINIVLKAAGIFGFFSLVFLPGGWLTFGLRRLSPWPFWSKITLGAVLSPIVVFLQYYLVRFLGLSFEQTVPWLAVLNLPAIILIWRKKGTTPTPAYRTIIQWLPAILVSLACLAALPMIRPQWRLIDGHPWMYSDEVYMIANGELTPEDPYLAGVTLSYPWPAHVYQAALGYLIESPPLMGFLWMNVLWLVFIAQLTASLVKRVGGNQKAAVFSVIGLLFGVNFLGYSLPRIFPSGVLKLINIWGNIWGDYRYTPWLLKFCTFNQEPFALAFFTGIVFLMADQWPEEREWGGPVLLFLLLAGLGLFFPQLLPVGFAVALGGLISMFIKVFRTSRRLAYNRLIVVGIAILLATITSSAHLHLVTHDSVKLTTLGISNVRQMISKSLVTLVVTFPLLCGLALASPGLWKRRRHFAFVLLVGIFTSCALHIVLSIPYFANEYKFIFPAAICLAPFFGLGFEPFLNRLRSWALPFTSLLAVVMAAPFFHKLYVEMPMYRGKLQSIPLVDTRHFELRLDERERLARLTAVIREKTPKETLLVTERVELNLPTVTQRKLLVPPDLSYSPLGVNLKYGTVLEKVRGYDKKIIEERLAILKTLFDQSDPDLFMKSLRKIICLGRPIGIILDENRHRALLHWLEKAGLGARLYAGEGLVFWLVTPPNGE